MQLEDYVCIRRYEQRLDAEMVAGLLEYRGIGAVVRSVEEYGGVDGNLAGELVYEVCVHPARRTEADSILQLMLSDL